MTDDQLRELERRYRERGRVVTDALPWYRALERAGQKDVALLDANGRLKRNRDERETIDYLIRTEPLAYTGWVFHPGADTLHVIDGDDPYTHPLSRTHHHVREIENIAYCDGLLYLVDGEGIQHTIPADPRHEGRETPNSFGPIADHENNRVLYKTWNDDLGPHTVTIDGTPVLQYHHPPDYISPGLMVSWDAVIVQDQPNQVRVMETPLGQERRTRADANYLTRRPYLIEDGKVGHIPTEETHIFISGGVPTQTAALPFPGIPHVPLSSRMRNGPNHVKTPYDLGVLIMAGNVTGLEVDLRVLEALRALRRMR